MTCLMDLPNDPYLKPYERGSNQWGLFAIRAPEAWQVTMGDPSVIIAIADQGVDISHPDLEANIWTNPTPGKSGFADDLHGWDFVDNDNTVAEAPDDFHAMGCLDHGSHVAGIAAAAAGNGIGIAGVAPRSRVMPIRVNGNEPGHIVKAIRYAVANGARLLNINGSYFPAAAVESRDERFADAFIAGTSELQDTALWAAEQGLVIVTTTGGNAGRSQWSFFAAHPATIAVQPCNVAKRPSSFCNRTEFADVAAPGGERRPDYDTDVEYESILSTCDGDYAWLSGGCMAAPHVSGVAALVLARHPGWTAAQVRTTILNTAQGVGWGPMLGHGVVDAAAAVRVERFEARLQIVPQSIRSVRLAQCAARPLDRDYKAAFFSPTADGVPVRLEAVIENSGVDNVADAVAVFYDGRPEDGGLQMGHTRFSVAGRESVAVSVDTALRRGKHVVAVLVDPRGNCAGQLGELGRRYLIEARETEIT